MKFNLIYAEIAHVLQYNVKNPKCHECPPKDRVVKILEYKFCIHSNTSDERYKQYLGEFNITYIIFRNVQIFKKIFFSEVFFLKERKESDEIFKNKPFFEMGSSKLIDCLTNMCQSGQGSTITATSSGTSIYEGRQFVCFVLFVPMRSTEPGCFRLPSWSLWKALEEEGCIGLVSWRLDLRCRSS